MRACSTWQPGPADPIMDREGLDLWRIAIDFSPTNRLDSLLALLSAEERARAGRFTAADARTRFITVRAALRDILSRYLASDRLDVPFSSGPHGKPALAGSDLAFNLAHSGGMALVGVARGTEIGVDIEKIREGRDLENIAARFFSLAEESALARLSEEEYLPAFYRCWSRKEAVIKALGEGLACPLHSFDVSIGDHDPRLIEFRRPGIDAGRWTMLQVDLHPGYAAAAAATDPRSGIRGYTYVSPE